MEVKRGLDMTLPRGDMKALKCWGKKEKQVIIRRMFVIKHWSSTSI